MAGNRKGQDGEKNDIKGCFFWHETRTVVMQELFDEVYVGEDHTPTAISFKLQLVKSVTREAGKTWEKKEATENESVVRRTLRSCLLRGAQDTRSICRR